MYRFGRSLKFTICLINVLFTTNTVPITHAWELAVDIGLWKEIPVRSSFCFQQVEGISEVLSECARPPMQHTCSICHSTMWCHFRPGFPSPVLDPIQCTADRTKGIFALEVAGFVPVAGTMQKKKILHCDKMVQKLFLWCSP